MFDAIARHRNPRYTGENRCVPCTITNVAIAAVGSLALWFVAPPLAVAALVASLLAVYLRGYLVPGTPAFTRRYFPDWLLAWFGTVGPSTGEAAPDVEGTLVAAGVLVEGPADLELDPAFGDAWAARIDRLDADRAGLDGAERDGADAADLAALTDLPADALDVARYGAAVVASLDGRRVGRWESRAAFVADLAAARELDDWVPRWRSLPLAVRSELLGALRLFLDRCPACDAAVTLDHEVVRSCCRDYDVVAASCAGCGARLLEADVDPAVFDPSAVETH
jgi:hypothetical protein